MAPNSSRNYVLACTIPAAIAVATYYWVKKKKKRTRIVRLTSLLANDLADVVSPGISTTCQNQNGLVEQNGEICSDKSLKGEKNLDSEANIETDLSFLKEEENIETDSSFLKEEKTIGTDSSFLQEEKTIGTDSSFLQEEKNIELCELGTADFNTRAEICNLKSCNGEAVTLSHACVIDADPIFFVDDKILKGSITVANCESGEEEPKEINSDDISAELNSGNFDLTLDLSLDSEKSCSLCNDTCSSSCLHDFSFCSSSSVTSSQLRMLDDSFVNAGEKLSSTPNTTNITYDVDLSDSSHLSVIPEESTANDSAYLLICDNSSAVVVEDGGEEEKKQETDYLSVCSVSNSSLCDKFIEKCQISSGECESQAESCEINEEQIKTAVVDASVTDLKTDVEQEIPVAPSPSLSTEEPELQKLTNGHETSAYGSASQSPAEDLLASPTASNYSDHNEWSQSERSSDSGKGGSDVNAPKIDSSISDMTLTQVYEFEIPAHLCGRMIGYKGQHVRNIKAQTRADVAIGPHPYNGALKMCAVLGSESEIRAALDFTRKRFPLSKYPDLSLAQVNIQMLSTITIPDTLQLQLPHGVTCDVILSSLVSAGHFFVQQPTHPTYPSLSQLDRIMVNCYSDETSAPTLPTVSEGVICAAEAMGGWFRAQVVYTEDEECDVRFLDYGGYARQSIYSLRQIRSDFMTLPFQATECYLANVAPIDESGWTLEATKCFEELAQGQILQAQIMSFADNGIPCVQLFRIQGALSTFINSELVNHGYATWIDHQTSC